MGVIWSRRSRQAAKEYKDRKLKQFLAPIEQKNYELAQKYKDGVRLGSGAYGVVRKCHVDGEKFAVKTSIKNSFKQRDILLALREIHILRCCNHENIVKFQNSYVNSDMTEINIVLELVDSDLDTYINYSIERLNHDFLSRFFYEVLLGLCYLNASKIVHRDLKPKNLGIKAGRAVILDFGCARVVNKKGMSAEIGTKQYSAPEALISTNYDVNCDIWSVGCTVASILQGGRPFFNGNNIEQILDEIFKVRGKPPNSFHKLIQGFDKRETWLTYEKKELSKSLWVLMPKNKQEGKIRSQLLIDFIDKCLITDPIYRESATNIIKDSYLKPCFNAEDFIGLIGPSVINYEETGDILNITKTLIKEIKRAHEA